VDAAIQQFNPYLVEVARSGACDNVKEARLLQLIADNSLLYTDVVTKIGLLDISQTAWTQDRCARARDAEQQLASIGARGGCAARGQRGGSRLAAAACAEFGSSRGRHSWRRRSPQPPPTRPHRPL
jgi:hypothetical protein